VVEVVEVVEAEATGDPSRWKKIKGETSGMIGAVFQCHSKQQKKG